MADENNAGAFLKQFFLEAQKNIGELGDPNEQFVSIVSNSNPASLKQTVRVHGFFPSGSEIDRMKSARAHTGLDPFKELKQNIFQQILNSSAGSLAARSAESDSQSGSESPGKPQLLVFALGDQYKREGEAFEEMMLEEDKKDQIILKKMFVPFGPACRDGICCFSNADHQERAEEPYMRHLENRWRVISGKNGFQKWIPGMLDNPETTTFTPEYFDTCLPS